MDPEAFDRFFNPAPAGVDVDLIRRQWLALGPPYDINARRLPLPVWARRGLTDAGPQAWARLHTQVARCASDRAFCIYIHVPFCASRCRFCDCYSYRLGPVHRDRHTTAYVGLLEQEMRLWSGLGTLAQRPVSTVHLGGGTPTFLDEELLERLVRSCRAHFNTSARTEWALESTSSEFSPGMSARLAALGFTRLHLGVQSLDAEQRRLLNRREPAAAVLEKTARAVAAGWVVSADLLFGLPAQTLEGLLGDIQALADHGVDGFSLYELQRSPRNRAFIERHHLAGRDRAEDCLLLQGASQKLTALGFRKSLFNHFARGEDANLYFTFPERGESCLALGTTADGVFNGYHYRHAEYSPYCRLVSGTFPGLAGGVERTAREDRLAPLEVALLRGRFEPGPFREILGEVKAEALLGRWRAAGLIAEELDEAPLLTLTASGSWFAGNMLAEVADQATP